MLSFFFVFYRSWPDNVYILQACYKLSALARKQGIDSFVAAENLEEIYGYVRLNLCSPSHVVRLLTLKILTCFDQPERSSSEDKVHFRNGPFYNCVLNDLSFEWKRCQG